MCGVKWEQLKPKTEPSRIRFYVLFSAGFVPKFSRKGNKNCCNKAGASNSTIFLTHWTLMGISVKYLLCESEFSSLPVIKYAAF